MDFSDILISRFPSFLQAFDELCPFNKPGQLRNHLATIKRLRELGSPEAALKDETFLQSLYDTLVAWGIGARGSVLKLYPVFVSALQARSDEIAELGKFGVDHEDLDLEWVAPRLGSLIKTLDIVENETKIAGGSKALHHLLPDLVPPMDRAYTKTFFGWNDGQFQYRTEECVAEALRAYVQIAQATNPGQYVKDGCWHSSRTKVIDNAIVGFVLVALQKIRMEAEPSGRTEG